METGLIFYGIVIVYFSICYAIHRFRKKSGYDYIEIRQNGTDKVLVRTDVSRQSDRTISRVAHYAAMSLQMNNSEKYVYVNHSETKLQTDLSDDGKTVKEELSGIVKI